MYLRRILHFGFIEQVTDFLDRPNMVRDAGFHRWRDAQGLVNPAEVVVHEVERDSVCVVLNFLRERVGQARRQSGNRRDGF